MCIIYYYICMHLLIIIINYYIYIYINIHIHRLWSLVISNSDLWREIEPPWSNDDSSRYPKISHLRIKRQGSDHRSAPLPPWHALARHRYVFLIGFPQTQKCRQVTHGHASPAVTSQDWLGHNPWENSMGYIYICVCVWVNYNVSITWIVRPFGDDSSY